jgi:uncharacterized protein YdeI (YjbR/CyaY-like superfamily)
VSGTAANLPMYQVHDAKRPETRAHRIAKFVTTFSEGKRPYP